LFAKCELGISAWQICLSHWTRRGGKGNAKRLKVAGLTRFNDYNGIGEPVTVVIDDIFLS